MKTELWKKIPAQDRAYEVSSFGRVRSLDCVIARADGKPMRMKGRLLKTNPNSRGYPVVSIHDGKKQISRTVHSLVARAFLDEPGGKLGTFRGGFVVNHINGDKKDNRAENLEYVTTSRNYFHAKETGLLSHTGSSNGRSKITDRDVRAIRDLYAAGMRQVDLAKMFGIDQTGVSRIVLGKGWRHVK